MNTLFDYLAVALLFLFPYVLAVVAFRAIRERSLMAVKVYLLGDNRWEYQGAASRTSGLRWRWPFMALAPRWFLAEETLDVIPWKGFKDTQEYWSERWHKDEEYYLLVKRPDRSVLGWLLAIDILLVIVFIVALWLGFNPAAPSAREITTTSVPTVIAPTSAPLPTATPEAEVEVIDGGDSIVINLGELAPASALLEWINGLPGPNLPALPPALEDWLNSLPWPEVAAFEMPEGMDGFVVVARKGDGFELVRLDENGNPIGAPLALKEVKEFTLHARELRWGIRYSDKFRVTNEGQGHIDVYVAESGEPSMATGYHAYNFRLWHIAIVIAVIIGGVVVYRRLTY